MAYAGAVLELTDALVSEQEKDADLFDTIEGTLDLSAGVDEALLDAVLWSYEVSLSRALGYGPELSRCVVCGKPVTEGVRFSPRRGGMVCAGCLVEAPGAWPLSDAAAAILARLPGGEGDIPGAAEATAAVRDEIGGALLAFLGEHAGHELRLKSLGFLAQVRRTGQYNVESEQEHEG
jgi:DNA repair protein RecO (recombination protein O)